MYFIYKAIEFLLMPVNLIIIALLASSYFIIKTKHIRKAKYTILALALFFLIINIGVFNFFLFKLEHIYPQFPSRIPINYVVVLDGDQPGIVEAIRIFRLNYPECKMILSSILPKTLEDLGVPADKIVFINIPKDTEQEANYIIQNCVKNYRFALVTPASHLPRSMMLFKHYGGNPVPAASSYLTNRTKEIIFYPDDNFYRFNKLYHEIFGIFYFKIKIFFKDKLY